MMPRAPKETKAARKSSGFCWAVQETVRPLASMMRRPITDWERMPCERLEPCVPVPMAPAMDCSSMLPRFGMARPCFCSSVPRSRSLIPLWMTITLAGGSMAMTALKSSRLISQLEVQERSLGEWPEPTTVRRCRHRRASVTIFWISAAERGRR